MLDPWILKNSAIKPRLQSTSCSGVKSAQFGIYHFQKFWHSVRSALNIVFSSNSAWLGFFNFPVSTHSGLSTLHIDFWCEFGIVLILTNSRVLLFRYVYTPRRLLAWIWQGWIIVFSGVVQFRSVNTPHRPQEWFVHGLDSRNSISSAIHWSGFGMAWILELSDVLQCRFVYTPHRLRETTRHGFSFSICRSSAIKVCLQSEWSSGISSAWCGFVRFPKLSN